MTGKAKVGIGDGDAVGEAKAEQDDEAMDYLLKPSLPFVAWLTLDIADATATAVAKIRIKQFLAIPLANKVVSGPCMMAMPPCVLYRVLGPRSRTVGAVGRIASIGDRYRHEDVSRMAGDAGRLVVERQERRDWPIPAEPLAEEFGGQQELGDACEGNAGRRGSDALQANATGEFQAFLIMVDHAVARTN